MPARVCGFVLLRVRFFCVHVSHTHTHKHTHTTPSRPPSLLQVISDSYRRVRGASITTIGSTHDSTSWECSQLGQEIAAGYMPNRFFLVADDAYCSDEQMIVPFSGKGISRYKGTFNFYQSSLRIEVECTLGAVQARWGVLWRPLRVNLPDASVVAMACFCLHNHCVNAGMPVDKDKVMLSGAPGDADGVTRRRTADGAIVNAAGGAPLQLHCRFQSTKDYDTGNYMYADFDEVGRGRHAPAVRKSTKRDDIAHSVHDAGFTRPPVHIGRSGTNSGQ